MERDSQRTMLVFGVGAAAGCAVGAWLWRRGPSGRIVLLKAMEGESIRIPSEERSKVAAKVVRAFYGHPTQLWDKTKGKVVTNTVQAMLQNGNALKADNNIFGDPLPGYTKALVIEIADDGSLSLNGSDEEEAGESKIDPGRQTNRVPVRPVHYVLRPNVDPRLDNSKYVRYEPHPERKSGAIIIVLPGGNYDDCTIGGGEGQHIAQWFVELGVTAIVLQYRCASQGHYWPAQFEDWVECAKAVRRDAPSWGCNPDRIGVIGFSAGGHLAGYASIQKDKDIRPNLQILVYPAIDTLSPHADGAMDAWRADEGYPPSETSIHTSATAETPPAFLAAMTADRYTPSDENTDVYAKVLEGLGVPCKYVLNEDEEEHHGCGLRDWWTEPCKEWLREHGWTSTNGTSSHA